MLSLKVKTYYTTVAKDSEWWAKLSRHEQEQYVKENPKTHLKVDAPDKAARKKGEPEGEDQAEKEKTPQPKDPTSHLHGNPNARVILQHLGAVKVQLKPGSPVRRAAAMHIKEHAHNIVAGAKANMPEESYKMAGTAAKRVLAGKDTKNAHHLIAAALVGSAALGAGAFALSKSAAAHEAMHKYMPAAGDVAKSLYKNGELVEGRIQGMVAHNLNSGIVFAKNAAGAAAGVAGKAAGAAENLMQKDGGKVLDAAGKAAGKVADAAKGVGQEIVKDAPGAVNAVRNVGNEAFNTAKGLAGRAAGAATNLGKEAVKDAPGALNAVKNAAGKAAGVAGKVAGKAAGVATGLGTEALKDAPGALNAAEKFATSPAGIGVGVGLAGLTAGYLAYRHFHNKNQVTAELELKIEASSKDALKDFFGKVADFADSGNMTPDMIAKYGNVV